MTIGKHTLTIFNRYSEGGLPPFGNVEGFNRTVIKYGQWEDSTDRNATNDGRNFIEQHISIIIPKTAKTGGKKYVLPMQWESLPVNQKLLSWTLKINDTYIAYGEAPDITSTYTIAKMQADYKSCRVSGIEDLTDQPVMPHFEVLGV